MNYDYIKIISNYYNSFKKKYPILYMFLKENKALKKFAINCKYRIGRTTSIGGSFLWDRTNEGWEYWSSLAFDYEQFEEKLLKEL